MWSRLVAFTKGFGYIAAAVGFVGGAYIAVGLPLPISEAAVNAKIDAKVNPIISILRGLETSQSVIIGDLTSLQRNTLRNERMALESALGQATPANKITIALRINQIADELAKLDRREDHTPHLSIQ